VSCYPTTLLLSSHFTHIERDFIPAHAVVFTAMEQDKGLAHATYRAVLVVDGRRQVFHNTPGVTVERSTMFGK